MTLASLLCMTLSNFYVCHCRTQGAVDNQSEAGDLSGTPSGPYAIICAGAVNQDGRSSGLTAPNGPSQTSLLQEALVSGQLQASAVGTVSVHGTGTPLGDPIEVGALGHGLKVPQPQMGTHQTSVGTHQPQVGAHQTSVGTQSHMGTHQAQVGTHRPLELVSNKSCFGHTEGAAGLTGLLLAVGCLQHCSRPPIMHLRGMNPHVGAALADWQLQMNLRPVIPRQAHGMSMSLKPPMMSCNQ